MKLIGIYLRARPGMGGTYQYNLSILSAAESINDSNIRFLVAYSSEHWGNVLKQFKLDSIYIKSSLFSRISANIWGLLKLPVALWRKLAPFLHPLTRSFLKQKCDLWIFPSQDSLSYWIPVKSVCTIHDLMHRYEPSFSEAASTYQRYLREFHYKSIVKWNAGVLVDSKTGKQQVLESYGPDESKIFPLPYIPPAYIHQDVSSEDIKNVRSKYDLAEKFFFYPAQFWKHKNHSHLIRAMKLALQECPDMFLVLSGGMKNNYTSAIKLIDSLGIKDKVINIGYISDNDVPILYHSAIALIMPTYFGPTNIPPLEAMACRCPVAVSDIYGMREQLGDAALYFDPDSVDDISNVMVRLWTMPELRAQLIKKGTRLSQDWCLATFSDRLKTIINKLTRT